jgi:DNA-binding protein H-NS
MASMIEQEIKKARVQLERLESERAKHRAAAVAFIRRAMIVLGVNVADVGTAQAGRQRAGGRAKGERAPRDGRSVVKPRYRGPSGETWSGRGKTPRWLVALESAGRKRSEYFIGPRDE